MGWATQRDAGTAGQGEAALNDDQGVRVGQPIRIHKIKGVMSQAYYGREKQQTKYEILTIE